MNKKKILLLSLLTISTLCLFTGCNNKPNNKVITEKPAIEYPKEEKKEEESGYVAGETVEVSGTPVLLGEKYTVNAYNESIEVIDLDFLNYGFGVTLPTTIFDPENVYYLQPQTNGTINITTNDANKILLNFMDDTRFTLVSYNYGMFSTWASSYDETTYYNIKRCMPTDLIPLVTETGFIEYKEGYRIAKYYDMYSEDAYRIEMEVDVYPFKGNTDFSYHGYLTMLCHDGIMRSILFAEPKFDENNPYQMIYPVSRSSYWLEIGTNWDDQPTNTIEDEEVEDREVSENEPLDTQKDFMTDVSTEIEETLQEETKDENVDSTPTIKPSENESVETTTTPSENAETSDTISNEPTDIPVETETPTPTQELEETEEEITTEEKEEKEEEQKK